MRFDKWDDFEACKIYESDVIFLEKRCLYSDLGEVALVFYIAVASLWLP
jgi:hypothetical protein